jgi:beta-lactamase regulating signal transducer with metallopeptidase domain
MANAFLKLLNISVAAGWLVIAVSLLRLIFKKAPRRLFCVLWAMVALRLLLPFSFQSVLSVIPSVNTVSVVEETPAPADISVPGQPSGDVHQPASDEERAQRASGRSRIIISTGFPALDNALAPAEPGPAAETGQTAAETEVGASAFTVTEIAAIIWISGAGLMLVYAAFAYVRLWRKVRSSKRAGEYYECENIDTPFVFGLFRPRIYLIPDMNGQTREHVLAHERVHIKRLDHIWKPLGYLLLSAYWFNPLAWLAYILFCRDVEFACDERVIANMSGGERADYSQTLLDLNHARRVISACPVAFGETGVKERVKRIFGYKKPTLWIVITSVVLCVTLAACMMTDPKDKSGEEESSAEESSLDESAEESSAPEILSYADMQFTDEAWPGKTLYRSADAAGKYPFVAAEREVFTFVWGGKTGVLVEGKYVTGTDSAQDAYAYAWDGEMRYVCGSGDGEPKLLGKLIVTGGGERSILCRNTDKYRVLYYDELRTDENSKFVIIDADVNADLPQWFILDNEGEVYALPVPSEYKWDVTGVAFDASTEDPDDVIAEYLKNGEKVSKSGNLRDLYKTKIDSYYYRKTNTGSSVVLRLTKDEDYPGRQVITGWRMAYPAVFVIDSEVFTIEDSSGAKATVYKGEYVLSKDTGKEITQEYVLLCGNSGSRSQIPFEKLGDNLVKQPSQYEETPEACLLHYVEDGQLRSVSVEGGLSCREDSDFVFFRSTESYAYEFDEWAVMTKSGAFRALPEYEGGRKPVFSIEFDENGETPDTVIVAAYIWDESEKRYDIKEFSADLDDLREVRRSEYYADLEQNEIPEITDVVPAGDGGPFFTCGTFPGVTLARMNSEGDDIYPCCVLGKALWKTEWNGQPAYCYYTDMLYRYNGEMIVRSNGSAVICGDTVVFADYYFPYRLHNIYVSGILAEDPVIFYACGNGADPEENVAIMRTYPTTRDGCEYILLSPPGEDAEPLVMDMLGNVYTLPYSEEMGDYYSTEIEFDISSDDPYAVVMHGRAEVKASLKDIRLDYESKYFKSPETGVYLTQEISVRPAGGDQTEMTSDAFPGRKLIYTGRKSDADVYPYPFCVIDKELFTLDWDGKKATGFEGRFVELRAGKPYVTECLGIVCGGEICHYPKQNASLYALGKLAIYENKAQNYGMVFTGCDGYFKKHTFDSISTREGSHFVLLYESAKIKNGRPYWTVLDADGNVRTLPLSSSDKRWALRSIEFDLSSDDPDKVIVHELKHWVLFVFPESPMYVDAEPFEANLNDTRVTAYYDYYTPDPVDHWDY